MLKETSSFNHVSILTRSKFFLRKMQHLWLHLWHLWFFATFVIGVATIMNIAIIVNIATIVNQWTSRGSSLCEHCDNCDHVSPNPLFRFLISLQYICQCHFKATLTFFQQNTPCFGFHYVFCTLHNFILMVFDVIKQSGKSSDESPLGIKLIPFWNKFYIAIRSSLWSWGEKVLPTQHPVTNGPSFRFLIIWYY